MTYEEHSKLLCEAFDKAIKEIDELPEEEAKKVATQNLIKIGILNPDGTIARPYANA